MNDLAHRIRHWRTQANLRQGELAKKVGVTPSAVSYWESGDAQPSVKNLEAIAKACGIELRIFWSEIPERAAR